MPQSIGVNSVSGDSQFQLIAFTQFERLTAGVPVVGSADGWKFRFVSLSIRSTFECACRATRYKCIALHT